MSETAPDRAERVAMLTVREAARRAFVSESVVRAWVKGGSLAHYRLGLKRGKIGIAVSDLDALVASFKVERKQPPPAPTPLRKPPRAAFHHLKLG